MNICNINIYIYKMCTLQVTTNKYLYIQILNNFVTQN